MKKNYYKDDIFLNEKNEEFINTFDNYNKYIKKLLELSPGYFEEFINNFNNNFVNFHQIKYLNKMNESYETKIIQLNNAIDDISKFLEIIDNKEIKNNIYLSDKTFLNDEMKKIHSEITTFHKNFENTFIKINMEKNNLFNKNDKNDKTIKYKSFRLYNNKKIISKNYNIVENSKSVIKKNKLKYNIFYIIFSIIFFIASIVSLIFFFY